MEGVAREVMAAFNSVPKRGAESGGLLLGSYTPEVSIRDFEPIICSHRFGPSFMLDEEDHKELAESFAFFGKNPDALPVGGLYRSHTRPGDGLAAHDREMFERYFRGRPALFLLLRPARSQSIHADIWRWREGKFEPVADGLRFPFVGTELELDESGMAASPGPTQASLFGPPADAVAHPPQPAREPRPEREPRHELRPDPPPAPPRAAPPKPEAPRPEPPQFEARLFEPPKAEPAWVEPPKASPSRLEAARPAPPPVEPAQSQPEAAPSFGAIFQELTGEPAALAPKPAPEPPPPPQPVAAEAQPAPEPAPQPPPQPEPAPEPKPAPDLRFGQPHAAAGSTASRRWLVLAAAVVVTLGGAYIGFHWGKSSPPQPAPPATAPAATAAAAPVQPPPQPAAPQPEPPPAAVEPTPEPAQKAEAKPEPEPPAKSAKDKKESKREKAKEAADSADRAAPDPQSEVRRLLADWSDAHRSGEAREVAAFYAPKLTRYLGRQGATKHDVSNSVAAFIGMRGVPVIFRLTDVRIEAGEKRATATFRKHWQTSGPRMQAGEEEQRLQLVREDGQWKIASEEELRVLWVHDLK